MCWGADMGKKSRFYTLAEELFVVDGLTLEAIAARLGSEGPSVTTLSNWKQDGEWDRLAAEWAAAQAELKSDSLRLRQKLVKRALDIMDADKPGPQELYAASAIASRLGKGAGERQEDRPEPEFDRPAVFLENLQFMAAALKDIDPEGLKVLARNFDLIVTRFKAAITKNAQTA